MIKRKFAAALVGLSVAMFGAASSAQAKELVVATDTAFVPFEFKQGNTYTGFDVDLWAADQEQASSPWTSTAHSGPADQNIDVALRHTFATTARRSSISDTTKAAWPSWSATRTRHQGRQVPVRQDRRRQDRHRHGGLPEGPGA